MGDGCLGADRRTLAASLWRSGSELIGLARERSPAALDKIFAIMNDEKVPPAVQLAAAGMIIRSRLCVKRRPKSRQKTAAQR